VIKNLSFDPTDSWVWVIGGERSQFLDLLDLGFLLSELLLEGFLVRDLSSKGVSGGSAGLHASFHGLRGGRN
jgi:hypothetical protein